MPSQSAAGDTPRPLSHRNELVILGLTQAGATFRPSDWAQRLSGVVASFGEDQRISYSPYVKPIISGGVDCVLIDMRLLSVNPTAVDFLLGFAHSNGLRVRRGREEVRLHPQASPDATSGWGWLASAPDAV